MTAPRPPETASLAPGPETTSLARGPETASLAPGPETASLAPSPETPSLTPETASPAPAPETASLARLLHKYQLLADLRAARARGEPLPPKAVFRTLAAEFPGALYELDRLPFPDIEARRTALAEAVAGAPAAPWMLAMATYHALYRAALHVKARTPKGHAPTPQQAASLATAASRHASVPVTAAFARAVALPARGRIAPAVLAEVASRTGIDEASLREALFPTRKDR